MKTEPRTSPNASYVQHVGGNAKEFQTRIAWEFKPHKVCRNVCWFPRFGRLAVLLMLASRHPGVTRSWPADSANAAWPGARFP